MARRIATVSGYALRPGVSRNRRLYTKDHIARAVAEAQEMIAAGKAHFVDLTEEERDGPTDLVSQRTHHGAEDDSTRIVGRVTSLTLEADGSARFSADLADTPHGRAIDSLVKPKQDPDDPDDVDPFLKGVSIRGAWSGKVSTVMHDGMPVEKGENLHIFGLDYTATPGVLGAEIDSYRPAGMAARESATGMHLIYESISEGQVETTTVEEKGAPPTKSGAAAAPPTKAPAGTYADPGYQGDKAKRYPLDTKARAKAAWSYINQAKNARNYTSAQLKRIKGRVKSALNKFGVEVSADESWLIEREQLSESVLEGMSWGMDDGRPGSFSVCLDNGMVCVNVSSYCVDPHDLDALGRAAMTAACAALAELDPDMDGDIDVPGAPAEDTDDDAMETVDITAAGNSTTAEDLMKQIQAVVEETEDPAPEAVADDPKGDPAMSEATAQASEQTAAAATTAPAVEEDKKVEPTALDLLSAKFDKLTDAISGLVTKMAVPVAVAATESAPVAPVKVEETEDQRITRLVEEKMTSERTKLIQDLVESGQGPSRKGLVAPVNETTAMRGNVVDGDEYPADWPTENGQAIPPHKLTEEQFRRLTRPMLEQAVLGTRSVYRQQ
jgi:hypothetical protein